MPKNSILDHKLEIYRKFLVQEFIREFKFIMDVQAGRATGRGDFTDKICAMLKWCATVTFYNVPFPGANKLSSITDIGVDWVNGKRKEGRYKHLQQQDYEFDQEELRILLEMVALEASRRYEFVIDKYLSDTPDEAIIPLAKTQVERMLEYVARNNFPLTQENLLTGIIAGHSGSYVTGWHNTKLLTKYDEDDFNAEGLCGRPAFISVGADELVQYWLLTPKERAVHKKNMPKETKKIKGEIQEITIKKEQGWEQKTTKKGKVRQLLNKIEMKLYFIKEKMFNFGYTSLKEGKKEPKYGYILVPTPVIKQFEYDEQPKETVSLELKNTLENYPFSIRVVSRQQIEEYLKSDKSKSFNEFIRSKYSKTDFKMTLFEVFTKEELNFEGLDFSNTDFSDCILNGIYLAGASLVNAKFKRSYLIGANLTGVNASKVDFSGAHLEYSNAQRGVFNSANFTQAHMHYADLQEAQMQFIQHLGSFWINANLRDIKTEDASSLQQLKERQEYIVKFEKMLVDQKQVLERVQTNLQDLTNKSKRLETEISTQKENKKRKREQMAKPEGQKTEETEQQSKVRKTQAGPGEEKSIPLSSFTSNLSSVYTTPKNSCLLNEQHRENLVNHFQQMAANFAALNHKFIFQAEQEGNKIWISALIPDEVKKSVGNIIYENLQQTVLGSLRDHLLSIITDNTIKKVEANGNILFIKTNTQKQAEKLIEMLHQVKLLSAELSPQLQQN